MKTVSFKKRMKADHAVEASSYQLISPPTEQTAGKPASQPEGQKKEDDKPKGTVEATIDVAEQEK